MQHNAMGFALQIIENLEGIESTIQNKDVIDDLCDSWSVYANAYNVFSATAYDSGV
jgi:hypothetical protein